LSGIITLINIMRGRKNKMANEEKEQNFPFDFGGNEYLNVIKSKRGYYCYGFVAGTSINTTGKDMSEIKENLVLHSKKHMMII